MAESKVRLYVKSVKTVTGTREIEREVVRTRARTIETEPTSSQDIAERARGNKDFPNFDCELRRET